MSGVISRVLPSARSFRGIRRGIRRGVPRAAALVVAWAALAPAGFT
jgi:hypothetical protein